MSRLEVDVKSIQKVIRDRALKAQKTLVRLEEDVRQTLSSSPLLKNLKKSSFYHTALRARDELRTRAEDAQERVLNLLNVPTRKDLDRLDEKVEKLSKKLKTEQKEKGRRTAETKTE